MTNEAKAIIKQWVALQRRKYGPDWKRILAKEVTDRSQPIIKLLLAIQKHKSDRNT